jgi:histidinol-phosphate aminotransferase
MAIRARRAGSRVTPEPVPWMATAAPAAHGSFDESTAAKLGLRPDDMLDFSANGNVIGPPPGVGRALAGVDLSRYPDRGASRLRTLLAKHHDVAEQSIVAGNGSSELIWSIAHSFLAPGDVTLVVGPTYGEYAAACAASGAQVETCVAVRPAGGLDSELLDRSIAATRPVVVWLCHPNNPTGTPIAIAALRALSESHPATLFVVDEAYLTLCDGVPATIPLMAGGNVVVLRSMTKDYALAGLRIGYALAPISIADVIRRALPPWTVNAVAQAVALAALEDSAYLARVREAVASSRMHLLAGLGAIGCKPYPSVANFVLVPVGDAAGVSLALIRRGFAVRDCTSFGLADCIRIGVRAIPDQERLLGALAEVHDG